MIMVLINILLTLKNLISQDQKILLQILSKNDIANFVKKDFDYKLKIVTANKNELDKLSEKVQAI